MGNIAKETTILSLSEEIRGLLRDFQSRLDNRFERHPECEEQMDERPVIPNILDEILGNLEEDRNHLQMIIAFISSDVLPKIN